MGNYVSKYQFGVNFTRNYDVRWVHISLCGRLTATCPQPFEEINMRWHLKRHGSLARHQFIVDSSYWPQWRLHLPSDGCTRMRHSYDVGVLSLCGVIPDLWAGTHENYIKLKNAVDGLPMGWWWIPASTNADTCDQKPSGAHIGDHTRKLFKIQAALSKLRLVQYLIILWLKGWWSFTILCGYIFQIYTSIVVFVSRFVDSVLKLICHMAKPLSLWLGICLSLQCRHMSVRELMPSHSEDSTISQQFVKTNKTSKNSITGNTTVTSGRQQAANNDESVSMS